MPDELINADFAQRVVIQTEDLPWIPSPQAGVERRMLDRIGGEVARATSLVRYAPGSAFPAHVHAQGEEFLVLEGVFSDEHGDYPAGTYVRNPPGSRHAPETAPGCVILVKLRQMTPAETTRVVIETASAAWMIEPEGRACCALHSTAAEVVTLERLEAGARLAGDCQGGEEIFVLSGALADDLGTYPAGTWIRNPAGHRRRLGSEHGSLYWVKRGHLRATP
jgi:anti-sigma factor ChrR (cupin superfamily)